VFFIQKAYSFAKEFRKSNKFEITVTGLNLFCTISYSSELSFVKSNQTVCIIKILRSISIKLILKTLLQEHSEITVYICYNLCALIISTCYQTVKLSILLFDKCISFCSFMESYVCDNISKNASKVGFLYSINGNCRQIIMTKQ
jgi:hypothetical protein